MPAEIYFSDRKNQILRPGDELHITDTVNNHTRRRHAVELLAELDEIAFVQIDEQGQPLSDGWTFDAERQSQSTQLSDGSTTRTVSIEGSLVRPEHDRLSLRLDSWGLVIALAGGPRYADWGYDEGILWIDLDELPQRYRENLPPDFPIHMRFVALNADVD